MVKYKPKINKKRQELLVHEIQLGDIEAHRSHVNSENHREPPAPARFPLPKIKIGDVRCKEDRKRSRWSNHHLASMNGLLQIQSWNSVATLPIESFVLLDREVRVEYSGDQHFKLQFNLMLEPGCPKDSAFKVDWRRMVCEANSEAEAIDWVESLEKAKAAKTWDEKDCKQRLMKCGKMFTDSLEDVYWAQKLLTLDDERNQACAPCKTSQASAAVLADDDLPDVNIGTLRMEYFGDCDDKLVSLQQRHSQGQRYGQRRSRQDGSQ